MTDNFFEESVDTQEIEDLVLEILRKYHNPYPADITYRVFLEIENDPNKLKRYQMYAGQDEETTNKWVGKMVKEHTGLKVKGTGKAPKSELIKTYSILGR